MLPSGKMLQVDQCSIQEAYPPLFWLLCRRLGQYTVQRWGTGRDHPDASNESQHSLSCYNTLQTVRFAEPSARISRSS